MGLKRFLHFWCIVWRITVDHYSSVILRAMVSQITGVSTVCSSFVQAQIKENIKTPRRWLFEGTSPVNSHHKGQVTRKMFPFDDVIMSPHKVQHTFTDIFAADQNKVVQQTVWVPVIWDTSAVMWLKKIRAYGSIDLNSLAPGKFEWNFRYVIFKQIVVIDG